MKKCPRCSIRYSDMWNICAMCHVILASDSALSKIFAKTRHNADYLFPLLERTIEQADVLYLYLDENLEPVMCNKAAEDITGYSRKEIFESDWLGLLFRDNSSRKEIFKAVLTSCLSSIKSRAYEGIITKKNGSTCVLSWKNVAVSDRTGKINGILCIAQDVTENNNFGYDISIQSDCLKNVFASVKNYALITTNLEDKITFYGKGSLEVFEWDKDMTLKSIDIIFPEQDRKRIRLDIKKAIQEKGEFKEEVNLIRDHSKAFPAILSASALFDSSGGKAGHVYIIRDITEEKKKEAQMLQGEKLAAIGQLASGIAHEINNPLLVILGRLELLAMEKRADSPAKETLDTVKSQAEKIRVIVERLLTYSRQKPPRMDAIDINDVLKTTSSLLSYYPEFENIKWEEKFSEGLPKIKGDFNQLQEMFLNLTLNACQSIQGKGAVTVSSIDTSDGFIEITVKDTGKGMGKEELSKIFTPFFTTKDEGTGLGLAICSKIVNLHNGKIEAESEPGKGSIFRVKLPVFKPEGARI